MIRVSRTIKLSDAKDNDLGNNFSIFIYGVDIYLSRKLSNKVYYSRQSSTVDKIVIYLKCINYSSFFSLGFKYIGVHLKC